MIHKKFTRILGVLFEPVPRVAEPETVAPGIHIQHQAIPPDPIDMVRQQDLQITYGRFLQVIATGVAIETISSLPIHANDVTGLMQERVHRRIRPHVDRTLHHPGFRVTPEAAPDAFAGGLHDEPEAITLEQGGQNIMADVTHAKDARQSVEICFRTMRTRSSTIASRSSSSSRALPSTSVES